MHQLDPKYRRFDPMSFRKFAVFTSAVAFAACGGGEKPAPESTPSQQPAAVAPGIAPLPITGTTHVVNMVGDANGYRYEPAAITINVGDGIRFESVSLGPHNIAFDPATLAPEAKDALMRQMPDQEMGELNGKFLNAGESTTMSFAGVPTGTYQIHCTPHLAMNMRMTVTVK
jgi:plastocyanin